MVLYDPAFGMPLLGSSNCGCQKIYKAVLLRATTYVYGEITFNPELSSKPLLYLQTWV